MIFQRDIPARDERVIRRETKSQKRKQPAKLMLFAIIHRLVSRGDSGEKPSKNNPKNMPKGMKTK
jgi:hypothetical protein